MPEQHTHIFSRCLKLLVVLVSLLMIVPMGTLEAQPSPEYSNSPLAIALETDRLDIVKDCVPVHATFYLWNTDEQSATNVTLYLYLLRNIGYLADAFTVDAEQGYSISKDGTVNFDDDEYTSWKLETTLPISSITEIDLTILQTEFIDGENLPVAYYYLTNGTEDIGAISAPNLKNPDPLYFIGSGPTDVKYIGDETGGIGEMPSSSSSRDVVIDGTLIIDEDYEFYGIAHLYMMPEAKIEVSDGSTLELYDMTIVEGCTEAWEGIEVEGGGALIMDGSTDQSSTGRVELHDAEIGVFAEGVGLNDPGAFVDIYNAVFEDNLVGVATTNGGGPHYINIDIGDVKFRQSAFGLKPPMSGTPVAALQVHNIVPIYQVTFNDYEVDGFVTGIDAESTQLLIHNNSFSNLTRGVDSEGCPIVATGNTFSNMTTGIHALESPLYNEYNSYEDMTLGINAQQDKVLSFGESFTDITGAGIYMGSDDGHSLTQSGGTFDNARVGIECRNINIISTDNQMDNASHGYRLYNGKGRSFDIRDNTINASNFGVLMFNWNSFGTSLIEDNTINIANSAVPDDAAGIRLAGMLQARPEYIRDNVIDIRHAEKGIDIQDCNTILAIDNTIQKLDATQVWHGIFISGGSYNYPFCNGITGATIAGNQRGISVVQASHVRPSCNTLDNTDVGIHFDGMSTHANIRSNDFHDHDNGLEVGSVLSGGGIIGVQPYRGNRWLETPDGDGLVHHGNITEVEFSQFFVNTDEGNDPEYGTTTDPPTGFLIDNDLGDNQTCAGGNFGCDDPPPPVKLSDFDQIDCAVAMDTITLSEFQEAQRWTAQRQLYRTLMEVADSISFLSSCLEDFYNEADTTTVGEFEQLRHDMQALFEPDGGSIVDFEEDYEEWNGLGNQLLSVLSELRDSSTTSQDSITLSGQLDSLILELDTVHLSMYSLDQDFQSDIVDGADDLLTVNAAIVTTTQWERNQRSYNKIWLEMMAYDQDTLSSGQLDTLLIIADQCPFAGGEAVHQARALLGEGYSFDDADLCDQAQQSLKGKPEPDAVGFTAYPNPGLHYVVVELEESAREGGSVTLTDMLGRVVKSQAVNEGDSRLYLLLDTIPSGMYYLTVTVGEKSSSELFSVAK